MLHLQELVNQGQRVQELAVCERLPRFLVGPCPLTVTYAVEAQDDFYILHLQTTGTLIGMCQRCMQEFSIPYKNQTDIAVCRSDARAEQLLEQYECIVSSDWKIDLMDVVIDELHLYAPQFHPSTQDCGDEIQEILKGKDQI